MDISNDSMSPNTSEVKGDSDLSPDSNSQISKSRYGRTRKPKISEDFYDIDVIFESKDLTKKVPRSQPHTVKSVKPKQSTPLKKFNDKRQTFEHVTADLDQTENIVEHRDASAKAIHHFFKTESGMSVLHNTEGGIKSETKCESIMTKESLDLQSVDVTQVLKIITAKTGDEKLNTEVKGNSKPVLKTYSNKRKSFNKLVVVESFGLPDTPIFPIKSENISQSEPKRIKSLDVATPSSENDVNLVDKKLLHTPWKIASMDAEIPDLDMLMESTTDDYREDSMVSPIKILNEVPSMFVEAGIEFEADSTFPSVDQIKMSPSPSRKSKCASKSSLTGEQKDKIVSTDILKVQNVSEADVSLNESRNQDLNKTEIPLPDSSQEDEMENNKSYFKGKGCAGTGVKHSKKQFKSPTKQKTSGSKINGHPKVADGTPIADTKEVEISKATLPPGKKSPRKLASTLRLMSCSEKVKPKRLYKSDPNVAKDGVNTVENIVQTKSKTNLQSPEIKTTRSSLSKSPVKNANALKAINSPSKMQKNSQKRLSLSNKFVKSSPSQKRILRSKEAKTEDLSSTPKSVLQAKTDGNMPKERNISVDQVHNTPLVTLQRKPNKIQSPSPTKVAKSPPLRINDQTNSKTPQKKRKIVVNRDPPKQLPTDSVDEGVVPLKQKLNSSQTPPDNNTKKNPPVKKLSPKKTLKSPFRKMQPIVLLNSNDINILSANKMKGKRHLLSLIRKTPKSWLKPVDVTPPATSPVRSLISRRTRSQPILMSQVQIVKRQMQRRSMSSGHVDRKIVEPKRKSMTAISGGDVINLESKEVGEKPKRGRPRINPTPQLEGTTEMNSPVVVGNMDTDVKEECLDELNNADAKNQEIKIGDLMWAKIGGHPFWPCLIVEEPNTQEFQKVRNFSSKSTVQTLYHVRFFGDKGRRSWVHGTFLLPFRSRDDLKRHFKIAKNKANFIVKPSALPKWKIAVTEAESQLKCSVVERLDFFTKMFAQEQEFDTKREDLQTEPIVASKKRAASTEEVKEDVQPTVDEDQKNDVKKPKRKYTKKSLLPNTSKSPDTAIIEKPTKKSKKATTNDKEVEIETKKLDDPLKEKAEPCTPPESITDLKIPWKTFDASEKNEIHSEYSSDTDTASKSSTNTVIIDGFQDEAVRQKRNSLFRGVSRDRVCQVCKESKEVFKCKGPCRGLYHCKCANFDVKPETIDINVNNVDEKEVCVKSDGTSEVALVPYSSQQRKFTELSIAEQIDLKMKEVMQGMENDTRYADSTTDYSSSEESTCNLMEKIDPPHQDDVFIHVTADEVTVIPKKFIESASIDQPKRDERPPVVSEVGDVNKNVVESCTDSPQVFQCGYCLVKVEPPCFVCGKDVSSRNESFRQKCSLFSCGKFYHRKCIKIWPQTQWSLISTEKHKKTDKLLDSFICPFHMCHTCTSDDPRAATSRCYSKKLAKCLHCPAAYHTTNYCIPAGTQILSTSQIICPRHFNKDSVKKRILKQVRTVNTPWCFICSKGGDLICCETCPTSVHTDCLTINLLEDDTFICEDCESGRFPLYDEIVWVKLGKYRWWPAVILFPNEVPDNVRLLPHNSGEFAVKFFGTHDHYWVGRGRVFLFQEGDKGHCSPSKKRVDTLFKKSIEEATIAHTIKKSFRKSKVDELKNYTKPPPYIRVKVNRPVGNVRLFDGNVSNTTPCECNPLQENPCGPDSDCLNRLLLTECDPNICPAKEKCNNQRFEKRQYPPLVPYKTEGRGWGLKTLAPINKGDFVIEYVGEIIDDQEYQRRIKKMHEQKDENYYFLTIDTNRIIDAGPKGNLARFMNHCCQPNCVTQKWTVNGDTRVGLFAIENVPADSEVTFNYNLECIGKEKKICKCGAPNCSGFIGVKVKDESQKKMKKSGVGKIKKSVTSLVAKSDGPCFVCSKNGEVVACSNKICTKHYHLSCVNLEAWPEGKWVCPWHNCNVCSKRTIRCCVKCTNSYCPVHSEGNVRYDNLLGFVCSEHDSTKEEQKSEVSDIVKSFKSSKLPTNETDVTSTTCDEIEAAESINKLEPLDTPSPALVTSTPIKKSQCVESSNLQLNKEIPQSSIPESNDKSTRVFVNSVKRKKGRSKKYSFKKVKLTHPKTKQNLNYTAPNLPDRQLQNEVKLSSSVPTRHLRTRSNTKSIVSQRFLRHQSDLEKDLPIRKRSRPRCELSL